jgi:ParB family transcriptional regulator, chromosome partitioning protein
MTETFLVKEIPLSKLKPSPANVRRTGSDEGLEELAASIAAHGLLQMPIVAPELDGEGKETGCYLVTAGERRRKALRLLAKHKKLARTAPIACLVRGDGDAGELSLAENTVRLAMHPADQLEAFARLHAAGQGIEEIAARFGVSPAVVRQRLKLAAVSPRLMAHYRAGELSLDQLMAFAITDDHGRQEEASTQLSWNRSPEMIRRLLTRSHVPASDRRARFIGAEAYELEGGTIVRDLFAEDGGGYLTDSQLLDRLVLWKLEAAAIEVRAEGWRWVEAHPEYPYGYAATLRRVYPGGEGGYAPEDVALAGAIVSLGQGGELRIERGLVRPEDEPQETPGNGADATPVQPPAEAGPADDGGSGEPEAARPLSAALVESLTGERTAALRECLAAQPEVALVALAHALALRLFYGASHDPDSCLCLELGQPAQRQLPPAVEESRAGRALHERHAAWAGRLPRRGEELWGWLMAQAPETRLSLLAYGAARTLDAVRRGWEGRTHGLRHAGQLARALGLDMAEWWAPTGASYLAHVPKARILEAVREGVSDKDAEAIAGLKKAAMVAEAERLLEGRRWLPEVLRAPAEPAPHDAAAAE